MNNNEIQVIERAAELLNVAGHYLKWGDYIGVGKNCEKFSIALRGLIDSSKAEALPVACANASGPKSAPRVKELEWHDVENALTGDPASCHTMGGQLFDYLLLHRGGQWFSMTVDIETPDLKTAKAACQADCTRRILSALEEEL